MSGIFQGVSTALQIVANGVQAKYNLDDGNHVGVGINVAQIGTAIVAPRLGIAAPFVSYNLDKAGAANETVHKYRDTGGLDVKEFAKTWAPVAVTVASLAVRSNPLGMAITAGQTGYALYGAYQSYAAHNPPSENVA